MLCKPPCAYIELEVIGIIVFCLAIYKEAWYALDVFVLFAACLIFDVVYLGCVSLWAVIVFATLVLCFA